MIIVLKPDATQAQIDHIVERITKLGLKPMISKGVERTIIGVIGPEDILRVTPLEVYPGVENVIPVLTPYKLAAREFKKEGTAIKVDDNVIVGAKKIVVMAGPCAVESLEGLYEIGKAVKKAG